MKCFPLLFAALLYSAIVRSQECDCERNLRFVMDKVSLNYAGYKDKVKASNKALFQAFSDSLLQASKKQDMTHCEAVINTYIRFFRDRHMYIYHQQPAVPVSNDSVRMQFRNWPSLQYTETSFRRYLKNSKSLPLEGIWQNGDNSYRLGLIYTKGQYTAFILQADSIYWMPGQVKFRMQKSNTVLRVIYYKKNHEPDTLLVCVPASGTRLDMASYGSFYKVNPATGKTIEQYVPVNNSVVTFTPLSGKTNLLTIRSFESGFIRPIDSVVKAHANRLSSTENLIIDLRGNGGGADAAYRPLRKYLYTNPYSFIGADLYCSDDNIDNFRQYAANTDFPDNDRAEFRKIVDSMSIHKGLYWSPWPAFTEEKMDSVAAFPKKIVVLIDQQCGSTTEQFLIDPVKNSRKAVIMGTPSGGVLDYANMNYIPMPCKGYEIGYATSRSKRIDMGKGIDNKGIAPDVNLHDQPGTEWVQAAQRYLEK